MAHARTCNRQAALISNHTKIRLTSWDRKWSQLVRKRDNDTCEACGNFGHTNAHHIESRAIKSLRFLPENGIALCAACHTFSHVFSAHKTPEAFKRWFKKRYSLRWEIIKARKRKHMSDLEAVAEFDLLLKAEAE